MVTTILFDYGGTLDTAARHWSYVLHEGYVKAGLHIVQETFRPAYVFAERALARYPYIRPEDDFLSLLRKKVALEVEFLIHSGVWSPTSYDERAMLIEKVALYCDCYARCHVRQSEKILADLATRYNLVVVSNFYGNLGTILSTYGIAKYFTALVESARVGIRKPSPLIWKIGVEAAFAKAEECLAVGDSFGKDVLPAHELGCQTVWFAGEEWEKSDCDESIPSHIIHSLEELLLYY